MGWPLVHSTFCYKTVSLDYGNREIITSTDSNDKNVSATCNNLLDFYANRHSNRELLDKLHQVESFIDFAKQYDCIKGVLRPRRLAENTIIITTPKVKSNLDNITIHSNYCYYQLIKYYPWSKETYNQITKNNSIQLWNDFLKSASPKVLQTIRLF